MFKLFKVRTKGFSTKVHIKRCYLGTVVQSNLKVSSNAPRVDLASSLSKAVDLGVCFGFFCSLRHLGEREEFYRTWE